MKNKLKYFLLIILLVFSSIASQSQTVKQWVEYNGFEGPGKGKSIVFVCGDEEYRSEEGLPMLAQILAKRYGFSCTVLFSSDPKTGEIDPLNLSNINGLEHLAKADLLVILTRFRELPDSQMKYIDEYIKAGKPVVGLRTSTHAFYYKVNKNSPYANKSVSENKLGKPVFTFGKASLQVGNVWSEIDVYDDNKTAQFYVNLKAGKTSLQAFFNTLSTKQKLNAEYVYVERIGSADKQKLTVYHATSPDVLLK